MMLLPDNLRWRIRSVLVMARLWNDTSPVVEDQLEGWYHDDALWSVDNLISVSHQTILC